MKCEWLKSSRTIVSISLMLVLVLAVACGSAAPAPVEQPSAPAAPASPADAMAQEPAAPAAPAVSAQAPTAIPTPTVVAQAALAPAGEEVGGPAEAPEFASYWQPNTDFYGQPVYGGTLTINYEDPLEHANVWGARSGTTI